MKRLVMLLTLLLLLVLFTPLTQAQRRRRPPAGSGKVAIPCPQSLNEIGDCPDTGCGPSLDPNLNRQKNIRSLDGEAEPMTIQQIRNLPDPIRGFRVGDTREKLAALGEGKKIVVVANAIAVRKGSGESCNCKLTSVAILTII